ncbi:MAG: glycosyltransferase family 39 protein [Rhodospirillaceae bacterium]|nr:glycosyltransferase family 39 protein [Rhodospirillaceae bacterium]
MPFLDLARIGQVRALPNRTFGPGANRDGITGAARPQRAGAAAVRRPWPLLAWTCLAVAAAFALSTALGRPFPAPFDEAQHLVYLRYAFAHGTLFPDLTGIRGPEGAANYLNHPALYYLAMGAVDRMLGGGVTALRLAGAVLHVAAFAMVIDAAVRTGCGRVAFVAVALLSVAMPLAHLLGGLITNDTLGFLAGALLVWSFVRTADRPRLWYAVAAAAVVVAGWTKLTAVLALFPVFVLAFAWAGRPRIGLALHLPVAAVVAALSAAPYLVWLARYGSVAPILVPTGHDLSPAVTLGFVLDAVTDPNFYAFLGMMLGGLAHSAFEPHPVVPADVAWLAFGLVAAAPVVAAGRAGHAGNRPLVALFAAGCLALAAEFAIHALFIYSWYVASGTLEGFHFRYYIGALPVVILAVGCCCGRAPGRREHRGERDLAD